jgi:hypothetical protein
LILSDLLCGENNAWHGQSFLCFRGYTLKPTRLPHKDDDDDDDDDEIIMMTMMILGAFA